MKNKILVIALLGMIFGAETTHAQQPRLGVAVSIPFGSSGVRTVGEKCNCEIDDHNIQTPNLLSKKPSFLKEVVDVLAATLIFSGLDYVYFQWLRPNDEALLGYRVFQLTTQVGLSTALYYRNGGPEQWKEGLKVAAAFNLLWWTFNADLVYYGIGELEKPGYFKSDMNPNGWAMRHAKWTTYGLVKSAVSGEKWGETKFTEAEIWTQALLGQAAAAGLLAVDLWEEPKTDITKVLNNVIAKCQATLNAPKSYTNVSLFMTKLKDYSQSASLFVHKKDAISAAFDRAFPLPKPAPLRDLAQ